MGNGWAVNLLIFNSLGAISYYPNTHELRMGAIRAVLSTPEKKLLCILHSSLQDLFTQHLQ